MKHEEALHVINLEILEPGQIMSHRWHINQAGSIHTERTVKSVYSKLVSNNCKLWGHKIAIKDLWSPELENVAERPTVLKWHLQKSDPALQW